MKRLSKCFLALIGVAFLAFAPKTTVNAAEAPAPFTAEQLMAAVNAQCATVNSLQEVLAESVQMTDAASGMAISANVVMDLQQSRTVSHSTTSMVISFLGYSQGTMVENYSALSGATLCRYTADASTGLWSVSSEELSTAQLVSYADPFGISGIDTKNATVMIDGTVCRVRTTMDAESMAAFNEMLESSGIAASGAFPVVIDIDAATLLPVSMTVAMPDMAMGSMPGMVANVNAVVTFSGYNQYDALAVPAEVVANAK